MHHKPPRETNARNREPCDDNNLLLRESASWMAWSSKLLHPAGGKFFTHLEITSPYRSGPRES